MSGIQAPSIVGIGEVLWDLLPDGAELGGASANFAVFCARLGNRAELISAAGDDELGHAALHLLDHPGLELHNLQITPEHPTGTVGVEFTADNQPSYSIREGVAWDFISLTPGVLNAASTADAICFGTLAQRHAVSRATIRGCVEATSGSCVRICDVNLRKPFFTGEILRWSLAHSTIIKVSDEELSTLFSLLDLGPPPATPEAAARLLLEHFPGAAMVAMTLGAKGCLLATRDEVTAHPGFPITLVDTVGAGDAFTAGLAHAYLRGAALAEIARIGNLCGGFVASRPGASPRLSSELIEAIAAALSERHPSHSSPAAFTR